MEVTKRKYARLTEEEKQFLLANIAGRTHKELTELFNAKFNRKKYRGDISFFLRKHGMSTYSCYRYTAEEKQFLFDNIKGRSFKELTEMFNAKFGRNQTDGRIRSILNYHGVRSGTATRYTAEEIQFLRDNLKGRSNKELTELFNAEFRYNKKPYITKDILRRHGLLQGQERGCRQPRAPRKSEIERVHTSGLIIRRIGEPGNYRYRTKHVLLWEAAYGPVPKGHKFIFINGRKDDVRLENLMLVTHPQCASIHARKLLKNGDTNLETVKAAVALADVYLKINELKKERKRNDD